MTVTIGRCTIDDGIYNMSHSGDSFSFSIDIVDVTLAVAKVKRQQLLGLVDNPDERVVPFTWSDDSDLDGFYRVRSVTVDPTIVYLLNGLMRCRVSLERVQGGFSLPTQELVVAEDGRSGGYSVTKLPRLWIPSAYSWQGIGDVAHTRATATGGVTGFDLDDAETVLPGEFTIAPADFYDGACLIEVQSGGTWYPVVGDQIPDLPVRISNGLVRFTPGSGPSDLHVYDGANWDLVGSFGWSAIFPASPYTGFGLAAGAVGVMRNSAEVATISIDLGTAYRLVVGIARGDMAFTCNLAGPAIKRSANGVIGASATTAATSIAGAGIRQTSNGATGHRWIMDAAKTSSADLTDGGINLTTSDSPHMLGVELNGSGSASPNTAANVRAQWWAAISQQQVVVSR